MPLLLLLVVAALAAEEPPPVGELGRPAALTFSGNAAFTDRALINGLCMSNGFLAVSHPLAPLADYLHELEDRLQRGYRAAGFPEASVHAALAADGQHIAISIVEGPRLLAGEIIVRGNHAVPAERLVESLTKEQPILPETQAGEFAYLRDLLAAQTRIKPLWVTGGGAASAPKDLDDYAQRCREAYIAQGYRHPDLHISVEPDPAAGIERLIVDVADEGPPARITRILVDGNQRDPGDTIIAATGLTTGDLATDGLATEDALDRAEYRLWRSARFRSLKLAYEDGDAPGAAILRISVSDLGKAPPLAQPLSEIEQAFLRWRDRLSDTFADGHDDIVATWRPDPAHPERELTFAVNPRQGLLAALQDPDRCLDAVRISGDDSWIAAPSRGRRLPVRFLAMAHLFIQLKLTPDDSDEHDQKFQFATGFSTERASAPLIWEADLEPAAFLLFAHSKDAEVTLADGIVVWTKPTGSPVLRLDAATGRLLELRWTSGSLVMEPARIDALARAIAGHGEEPGDAASGLATLAVLAWDLISAHGRASFLASGFDPLEPRVQLLANQLDELGEAIYARFLHDEPLPIPAGDGSSNPIPVNLVAVTVDFVAGLGLASLPAELPMRSWPVVVGREAALIASGGGHGAAHATQVLRDLLARDDVGPLCDLVVATLLERSGADANAIVAFARRGLQVLQPERLIADLAPLAPLLVRAVDYARSLDDPDAFAQRIDPAHAALIAAVIAHMREVAPTRGADAAWREAVTAAWDRGLRDELARRLAALPAGADRF